MRLLDCRRVANKSHRNSDKDECFICNETRRLLKGVITEPSSPNGHQRPRQQEANDCELQSDKSWTVMRRVRLGFMASFCHPLVDYRQGWATSIFFFKLCHRGCSTECFIWSSRLWNWTPPREQSCWLIVYSRFCLAVTMHRQVNLRGTAWQLKFPSTVSSLHLQNASNTF